MAERRAVIFDLDGTLADTLRTVARALNAGLATLGLPPAGLPAVAAMVGEGMAVLCERALPPARKNEKDALLLAVRAAYERAPLEHARLYHGMADAVRELKRHGARLAVLSNKPDSLTQATVTGLGVADSFDVVLGQTDRFPRKPDPASLRAVMERLGVAPADTLYVGDTAIDMQTGKAAGATVVAVSWGFRPLAELMPFAPDHVVHFPAQVVELFTTSR